MDFQKLFAEQVADLLIACKRADDYYPTDAAPGYVRDIREALEDLRKAGVWVRDGKIYVEMGNEDISRFF